MLVSRIAWNKRCQTLPQTGAAIPRTHRRRYLSCSAAVTAPPGVAHVRRGAPDRPDPSIRFSPDVVTPRFSCVTPEPPSHPRALVFDRPAHAVATFNEVIGV